MVSPADHPQTDASLRAGMRTWRAAHPTATLAEIEREATRQLAGLRTELIAAAIPSEAAEAVPMCTTCRQPMRRIGTRHRTIITDQHQTLTLTGPRYRCSACGAELFPPSRGVGSGSE